MTAIPGKNAKVTIGGVEIDALYLSYEETAEHAGLERITIPGMSNVEIELLVFPAASDNSKHLAVDKTKPTNRSKRRKNDPD